MRIESFLNFSRNIMSVVLRCKLSLHDGATFNLVSKVIHDCFGFAFLCSVITITLILVFRNSTENCCSLFQLQMKPLVNFFCLQSFSKDVFTRARSYLCSSASEQGRLVYGAN